MTGARSAAGRVPPTTTSAMASAHDQRLGNPTRTECPRAASNAKSIAYAFFVTVAIA